MRVSSLDVPSFDPGPTRFSSLLPLSVPPCLLPGLPIHFLPKMLAFLEPDGPLRVLCHTQVPPLPPSPFSFSCASWLRAHSRFVTRLRFLTFGCPFNACFSRVSFCLLSVCLQCIFSPFGPVASTSTPYFVAPTSFASPPGRRKFCSDSSIL